VAGFGALADAGNTDPVHPVLRGVVGFDVDAGVFRNADIEGASFIGVPTVGVPGPGPGWEKCGSSTAIALLPVEGEESIWLGETKFERATGCPRRASA